MSLTRANIEAVLIKRCGHLLTVTPAMRYENVSLQPASRGTTRHCWR